MMSTVTYEAQSLQRRRERYQARRAAETRERRDNRLQRERERYARTAARETAGERERRLGAREA